MVDQLAGQFAGTIRCLKINVDEAPALADRFAIQGVPTLLFFHDGKVVDRQVGSLSADALKARLEALSRQGATPAVVP